MKHILLAAIVASTLMQHAFATRGVIDDPDGSTNLRAARSRESSIVATVKNGEVIDFKRDSDTPWWEVTLGSGKTGFMHTSRIRLYASMAQLADTKPTDEVNEYAASHGGFAYYPVARAAARGDAAALKTFFGFKGDGAAAETHWEIASVVIHLLGDRKLADFLGRQSASYNKQVREVVENEGFYPLETGEYLKRHFPRTHALLFR